MERFSFFFIYAHNTQTDSVHKYCIALIECLNIIVIERKRSRQKQLKCKIYKTAKGKDVCG